MPGIFQGEKMKQKTRTLREKIWHSLWGVDGSPNSICTNSPNFEKTVDRILRLIRDEQREKCKKCLEQTVENIKAREMERMGMDSSNSDFYKGIK
jgi:hypothetical protein